ncbi:MAG: DODA-type extradiol aromatic ring-opening family dioxygenase [Deltaproteobacteria bacterium]
MTRREAMKTLAAAAAAVPLTGAAGRRGASPRGEPARMPAIFLAHGAPMLLDDAAWMGELASWAQAMARPRGILMLSAHWEDRPATLGATRPVPLVYDFYGFPAKYYQVKYPSPGAPELGARVRSLLAGAGLAVADEPERGLDHGVFVPLLGMYPNADVPVLQLSLPSEDPQELFGLGMALSPLRREGILIAGSGFLTHNLRLLGEPGIPAWAREFDAWAKEALLRRDFDTLQDYRAKAPAVELALPTREHFVPVLVASGASAQETEAATFPIEGFWMNRAFTRRSVQFG